MKIVFATGNLHKLREAQEILGEGFELVSPASLGIDGDVPETGETLRDNSIIKAEYLYEKTGLDCFADDTGLEVDALGGAPGVHTARYAHELAMMRGLPAPPDHEFTANMDTLLAELGKLGPDAPRTARFRSVITLIISGEKHFFEGVMEGRIAMQKAGCGGFGYDPVFIADLYPDVTVAELPEETKNAISHRGNALRLMAQWLRENAPALAPIQRPADA